MYGLPALICILLFFSINQPNPLNYIPYSIRNKFLFNHIDESKFIYTYNFIITIITWIILHKIMRAIIKN